MWLEVCVHQLLGSQHRLLSSSLTRSCQHAALLHCRITPASRYTRNAWGFGWYRRYKRNYAPGWSRPSKFIGHKRHLLEQQQDDSMQQHPLLQAQGAAGAPADAAAGAGATGRRALLQAADVPAVPGGPLSPPAGSQLQNETIMVPPCLLSSTYYKNACKQCNYSRLAVKVTVTPTRRGLLNATSSANPLGFVAPTIAVTPGGSVVVIAGYAGPNNHPNSSAPAYPGEGMGCGLGLCEGCEMPSERSSRLRTQTCT